jgi:copper chaperone
METENITIANLSCNGCVNTITKKLTSIKGVETVKVDLETNNVSINHNEIVSRKQLTEMLLSIGYPEATEKNGLLTQLKSIKSCLTGKLTN